MVPLQMFGVPFTHRFLGFSPKRLMVFLVNIRLVLKNPQNFSKRLLMTQEPFLIL